MCERVSDTSYIIVIIIEISLIIIVCLCVVIFVSFSLIPFHLLHLKRLAWPKSHVNCWTFVGHFDRKDMEKRDLRCYLLMDLLFSNVFAYLSVHIASSVALHHIRSCMCMCVCDRPTDQFDMNIGYFDLLFFIASSWMFHRVLISAIISNNNLFTFSSGPIVVIAFESWNLCFIAALPCSFSLSLSSFHFARFFFVPMHAFIAYIPQIKIICR